MDKKLLEFTSMKYRSPGPAAYCIKPTIGREATDPSIKRNPVYSFQGRKFKDLQSIGPGPAFNTCQLNRHGKERTLGGVMGQRFRATRQQEQTPGPADYCMMENRSHGGPLMRRNIGKRCDEATEFPAPNAYILPGTLNQRGYRMAAKQFRAKVVEDSSTPGPNYYNMPHGDVYLNGSNRNGRSLGKRLKDLQPPLMPGPADYDGLVRATCHAMRCHKGTFGIRRPDHVGTFAVPEDNQEDC